jgi:hypothetical protein
VTHDADAELQIVAIRRHLFHRRDHETAIIQQDVQLGLMANTEVGVSVGFSDCQVFSSPWELVCSIFDGFQGLQIKRQEQCLFPSPGLDLYYGVCCLLRVPRARRVISSGTQDTQKRRPKYLGTFYQDLLPHTICPPTLNGKIRHLGNVLANSKTTPLVEGCMETQELADIAHFRMSSTKGKIPDDIENQLCC